LGLYVPRDRKDASVCGSWFLSCLFLSILLLFYSFLYHNGREKARGKLL